MDHAQLSKNQLNATLNLNIGFCTCRWTDTETKWLHLINIDTLKFIYNSSATQIREEEAFLDFKKLSSVYLWISNAALSFDFVYRGYIVFWSDIWNFYEKLLNV